VELVNKSKSLALHFNWWNSSTTVVMRVAEGDDPNSLPSQNDVESVTINIAVSNSIIPDKILLIVMPNRLLGMLVTERSRGIH